MPKKINHYKLESIKKKCDIFFQEKGEKLAYYKKKIVVLKSIEQNHTDRICELKELFCEIQNDILQIKDMRNTTLLKLEQEDYNVSKGVLDILDGYENTKSSLYASYNECLQKMNLLFGSLTYEDHENKLKAYKEQKNTEEQEEVSIGSLVVSFLSRHIKLVVVFVVAIVAICYLKSVEARMEAEIVNMVNNLFPLGIVSEINFKHF